MASRVTLDIDGYVESFEMVATRAYYELCYHADDVEVDISSGGEGIHLVGWFNDGLSQDAKDALRLHLGDDTQRFELDEQRRRHGHTTNVLWTEKGVEAPGENVPERDFDDIEEALGFINANASWHDRFKKQVQRGLVV